MNVTDLTQFLTHGAHLSDGFLFIDRVALGCFFTSSGWHKFFNKDRRQNLIDTFKADKVYNPLMPYVIPGGEFFGGLALMFGLLALPAAIGLVIICLGACLTDGFKRIKDWKPLDRADYVSDVLYLPEVLYIAMLAGVIFLGAGSYSLDSWVWTWVAGVL